MSVTVAGTARVIGLHTSSLWVSKALVSRAAADRAINEINAHSENMMVEPHGEEKHNAESTPTL